MSKQSIKISTLIIILTIAMVYLQFFCYYFFEQSWVVLGITVLTALALSHFSLSISLSYEPGFLQSLFSALLSFAFILFLYFNQFGGFLVYRRYVPLILLLNWLVPFCYFLLRCLYDRGPRFVGYRSYFTKTSILFLAFYLLVLADKLFLRPLVLSADMLSLPELSLTPFMTTASYIEAYIYNKAPLMPLVTYLVKTVILYIPFGFYLGLLGKNLFLPFKCLLLFLLPLALESARFLLQLGRFDMDDFFFALLGGILGMTFYAAINHLFIKKTNYFFLKETRTVFTIFK